ncbi:MAG: RHS repeat-associated core domain-containing protein, partial [Bacteroidota bacterium]
MKTVRTAVYPEGHSKFDSYLHATYEYYKHGPLKRVVLAEDLQGIDYSYTPQGWLKGINHPIPDQDPGGDGIDEDNDSDLTNDMGVATPDAFGMSLEYHDGDYENENIDFDLLNASSEEYPQQYNGNIRGLVYGGSKQGEFVVDNHPETIALDRYRKTLVKAVKSITLEPNFDTNAGTFDAFTANEPTVTLIDAGNVEADAFQYDDQYQVIKSKHGEAADLDNADNAYDVHVEGYDQNGNLLGINRYDDFAGTPRDDFEFHYSYDATGTDYCECNRLVSVSNYVERIVYNDIGQVISVQYHPDAERQDIGVLYDVTGKVTRVYSTDTPSDTLMKVLYDDRGFRLKKTVGEEEEYYIRNASGKVLAIYRKSVGGIAVAQKELPIYGAGRLGISVKHPDHYKYLYELNDHLGNVRAVITKLSLQATATLEVDDDPNGIEEYEAQYFDNLTIRQLDQGNSYHGKQTAHTHPGEPVGPTTTLRVEKGDLLNLQVFVKEMGLSEEDPSPVGLTDLLTQLTNDGVVGLESGTLSGSVSSHLGAILAAVGDPAHQSKAYLQYILFDESYQIISHDYAPMEEGISAEDGWKELVLSKEITEDGYLFAYMVNESQNNIYFDDFTFQVLGTRVLRKSDYYPFGAVAKNWSNPSKTEKDGYRYGYQGQYAEQDSATGWNAFELRMYDPLIGRFLAIDPYNVGASPYSGMANNPIYTTDPDGGCPKWLCGGGDDLYSVGAEVTNNLGSWEYLGGGRWKDLNRATSSGGFSEGFWDFMGYLDTFVPQGNGDVNPFPVQFIVGGKGGGGENPFAMKSNPDAKSFYVDYDE